VDDEETISDLVADALSFDLRSMPDSLGSRVMGRGSRPVRRWRHDRKKKKAARDKRNACGRRSPESAPLKRSREAAYRSCVDP